MSNRFTLEIRMDGAAFEDNEGPEVARLLAQVVENIKHDGTIMGAHGALLDFNGNKVGAWEAEEVGC